MCLWLANNGSSSVYLYIHTLPRNLKFDRFSLRRNLLTTVSFTASPICSCSWGAELYDIMTMVHYTQSVPFFCLSRIYESKNIQKKILSIIEFRQCNTYMTGESTTSDHSNRTAHKRRRATACRPLWLIRCWVLCAVPWYKTYRLITVRIRSVTCYSSWTCRVTQNCCNVHGTKKRRHRIYSVAPKDKRKLIIKNRIKLYLSLPIRFDLFVELMHQSNSILSVAI